MPVIPSGQRHIRHEASMQRQCKRGAIDFRGNAAVAQIECNYGARHLGCTGRAGHRRTAPRPPTAGARPAPGSESRKRRNTTDFGIRIVARGDPSNPVLTVGPLLMALRDTSRRSSGFVGTAAVFASMPRCTLPDYSIAAGKVNYRKQVASVFLPDDAQNAGDAVTYVPTLPRSPRRPDRLGRAPPWRCRGRPVRAAGAQRAFLPRNRLQVFPEYDCKFSHLGHANLPRSSPGQGIYGSL